MTQVLNLDAITCAYIDIIKHGEAFHLRDDVPTEVLLTVFALSRDTYLAGVDANAPPQVLAAMERYQVDVAHLVGQIFRHTLPEVTDARIRELFSLNEQEQIFQLFFLQGGERSNLAPAAPAPSTAGKKRRRRRH